MSEQQAVVEPIESWGIVELMGRKRLAGRLCEENHFGVVMGRIDIPQSDGSFVTQWFGGSSVYCVTPTSEAIARAIATNDKPKPVNVWELSHLLPARAEQPQERDGEDDEDDHSDDDHNDQYEDDEP